MAASSTAAEVAVKVAVPKASGKRYIRTVGIYVPDRGTISVDIPHGLQFGDEFEYLLPHHVQGFGASGVLRIPVPDAVVPGTVFKHRAPNGKNISVSCPPGVETHSGDLLVPWSNSTNEHFVIQAHLAPPDAPKPTRSTPCKPSHSVARQIGPGSKPRVDDDLLLAQALSLTTLQPASLVEDTNLKQAMEASLKEYHPAQALLVDPPMDPEDERLLKQVLKQSVQERSQEDMELERSMKASLGKGNSHATDSSGDDGVDFQGFQTQRKRKTNRHQSSSGPSATRLEPTAASTAPKSTKAQGPMYSNNTRGYSSTTEMTEEEMLRLAEELSLREAREQLEKQLIYQDVNTAREVVFPRQAPDGVSATPSIQLSEDNNTNDSQYPGLSFYSGTGGATVKHPTETTWTHQPSTLQSQQISSLDAHYGAPITSNPVDSFEERLAFLNSLPEDIRREVLQQETLQERAFHQLNRA